VGQLRNWEESAALSAGVTIFAFILTTLVADRHLPSKIQLVWSRDDKKAALLINSYPHAIIDFEARRALLPLGISAADPRWLDTIRSRVEC
jgi:hypothetical protein